MKHLFLSITLLLCVVYANAQKARYRAVIGSGKNAITVSATAPAYNNDYTILMPKAIADTTEVTLSFEAINQDNPKTIRLVNGVGKQKQPDGIFVHDPVIKKDTVTNKDTVVFLFNIANPNVKKVVVNVIGKKLQSPLPLTNAATKQTSSNIELVYASVVDEQNECVITDKDQNYFVPATLPKQLVAGDGCSTCLNDYKVVYNLAAPAPFICYYKRKKAKCNDHKAKDDDCDCSGSGEMYYYKPKKRIRPWVGQSIGYHIFGYYPYYDSISFSTSFESRNLEGRDAFAAAIALPAQEKDTDKAGEKTAEKGVGESTSTDDARKQLLTNNLTFFSKMREEFKQYYDYLALYAPDLVTVNKDIAYINAMLNKYCISVEEFTEEGLIQAIDEYLANQPSNDNKEIVDLKEKIRSVGREAAMYYGFIVNYNTVKIPVVQVENEDMMKWEMGFYRKGKKTQSGRYSALVTGGWKIDFSTGFVLNDLRDNEYEIKYDRQDITPDNGLDDTVDLASIVRVDKGKYNVNLGLMAHIYPRTGTRVNVAFNTGLVLQNGNVLKYLAGGSLIFGYEQRFILSYGVSMGNVKRLDNTYEDALNTFVPRERLNGLSTSIPTVDYWTTGFYFGVTYNLGGVNLGGKKG